MPLSLMLRALTGGSLTMTDVATRSPDAVLKQLPRLRELLGRYGLGYALALFLVCINLLVLDAGGAGIQHALSFSHSGRLGRRRSGRMGARPFGHPV